MTTINDIPTKTIYKVEGMDCDGCVKAVTRSIQGYAPKASVVVELEQGLVAVEGASDADVEAAVKAAGFDFKGKQAAAY